MSVEVSFQPAGLSGLIAEGTYLIDAARRMGLRLPVDCRERGECTSCVVTIIAGQTLLSQPTSAEIKMLAEERLAKDHRLACQTRIENAGELLVRLMPVAEDTGPNKNHRPDSTKEVRAQMEQDVIKVIKGFDAMLDRSLAVGEKMLDRFSNRIRSARERELDNKRPPEHRQGR